MKTLDKGEGSFVGNTLLTPEARGFYDLKIMRGTPLVVQWLRVHPAMYRMRVQPWVGELRSYMTQSN